MTERRSYAVTGAVLLGALAVVGVPTAGSVTWALQTVAASLVGGAPSWFVEAAIAVVALVLGATAATEAARVQLHGWSELHRGSPRRRLARHALLAVPILAVLVLLFDTVVGLVAFVSTDGFDPIGVAMLAATALVVAYVVGRAVLAFRDGRREARETAGVAQRVLGPFRK